ncbi:MAG: type II secretion system protein [Armatimonadota bacterium]|nr:type II secretion system protein [Armatimonadota bacterium]MDR7426725.1 type II secretion system protein [Armatimonadota bacterium]MDR7463753.1 type II secretion system protein [Armatimonadota bacterium]MDR7469276.1 type II secretion system protein [Armatimonadota bacterium]MDR7475104.1 type II secretion system protein [Armatimonadota bacterium]
MMRQTHREGGFGLMEVMLAVALYAIALVSLFGLLITSVTAGTIGESAAVAVNLARQRMEGLAALDVPTMLAEGCGTTTTAQVPDGQGRPYTITVGCLEPPGAGYVDVTVTVRWTVQGGRAPGGGQYARTLQTRVAR